MPVEIREVVIRAIAEGGGEKSKSKKKKEKEIMDKQVVIEMFSQIMNNKKER
ncbi:MAG: hypothetical protein MI810_02330 [Flavobacteriales bacterium]|nr:hypothetical protein [Flavobacteriales bacterium]